MKINATLPKISQNNFIWTTNPVNKPSYRKNTVKKTDDSTFIDNQFKWLKNETLKHSLKELYDLKFDVKDINYLNSLGLKLPFNSGDEVVNYLASQNTRIVFDKIMGIDIHANYDYEKNSININDLYKNDTSKPVILAIASAILHEASHAKDKDGTATIQEELECLGMNAVAHRAFIKKYSNIFETSDVPIIRDGVSLYANLFFNKQNISDLIERVRTKYGNLPAGDEKHPASSLAYTIKSSV